MQVIGFLNSGSKAAFTGLLDAFRKGLADSGCVEGQDYTIESHWADGRYDQLPSLAAALVKRSVDIIAATGGMVAARAAMAATDKIPIVFVGGYDPAEIKFDSKKGPGANATGISVSVGDYLQDLLARMKDVIPSARKIGILLNPRGVIGEKATESGRKAGLIALQASTDSEIEAAFQSAASQKIDALVVSADPFFMSRRDRIVQLASQQQLPTAYPWRAYAEAGGLMSYGPNLDDAYRQAGAYAGRIVKKAKPGELPIQVLEPAKFKMVVNEQSARALRLETPPKLREQAEFI